MVISEFVGDHNSHPYNRSGMQKEEYSLNDVERSKQPNLEPTAFNAKKALLPDEQRSVVRRTEDGETVRSGAENHIQG